MNSNIVRVVFVIGLILGFSTVANSATLIVNSGKLIGATDVQVGGSLYDVTLTDGICSDLFDGCDATSDFPFTDAVTAQLAAQALYDQVLIDSGAGNFDSNPGTVEGCALGVNGCSVIIPYETIITGNFRYISAFNHINEVSDEISDVECCLPPTQGTSAEPTFTYAVFNATAVVPIPAAGFLMLPALITLIGLRHRRGI